MKKILLISLLLFGVALAGCSQQSGTSQDDTFQNNEKCASYKDKIESEINPAQAFGTNVYHLDSIFYSPVRKSCIYFSFSRDDNNDEHDRMDDYFTNENLGMRMIETCMDNVKYPTEKDRESCDKERDRRLKDRDQKIAELKGE